MKKLISIILSVTILCSMLMVLDLSVSAKSLTATTISSIVNTKSGISLKWKKISNATKYIVERKASSAKKYSAVKTVKKGKALNFTDKKVKAGKKYSYRVTAYAGKTGVSSKAKSVVRLLAPKGYSVSFKFNTTEMETSAKLSWKKVAGAKKYEIYRKGINKKYELLSTTKLTKYTNYISDDGDVSGHTYSYKVRAVNGKSKGVFTSAKSKYIIEPAYFLASVSKKAGVKLEWFASYSADYIDIYRATGTGKYTKIKSVSGKKADYLDKTVKVGTTYKYYVVVRIGKKTSQKSIVSSIKYGPITTINVKIDDKSDALKTAIKNYVKKNLFSEILGDVPEEALDTFLSMVKVNVEDENIATVSSDFEVTGVTEGTTDAVVALSAYDQSEEIGYFTINVTTE